MNKIKVIIAFVFIVSLGYSQKVTTYREHFFETDTLKAIKDKVKEISDKGQSININVYKFSNFILPNKKGYLVAYDLMDKIVDVQKSTGMVNRNMLLVEDMHERIVEYTDYIVFVNGSKIDTLRDIENSKKIVTRIKLARNNKLPADTLALKKIDSLSEKQITFKYDDNIKKNYNASIPKKIREILEVLEVLEKPLPGDPLMEMRIVNNNTAPDSGGKFGCARVGIGCEGSIIPNLPKFADKKKPHGGIDLYAPLDTKIYAMYDGVVEKIISNISPNTYGNSDFGNRIRIKSTSVQHNKNQKTIYIYYTHLNKVEDLKVGDDIKQGQLLGLTGSTGNANEIPSWRHHSHITVYENSTSSSKNKVNPENYFGTKDIANKNN